MRHISWLVSGVVVAPAVLFLTTQVAGCGGDDAFLVPGSTGDGGVSSLDGSLPDGTVGPGQDAGDAATVPADGGDGGTTPLSCDDSIITNFKPDANTTVLSVHAFAKGDALTLSGADAGTVPVAPNDLCVVKLNVGPGNPGAATDPSTSPGIGIEVWLPSAANWNKRIHVVGGGGWQGGTAIESPTALGGVVSSPSLAYQVAGVEGAVSAVTDTGHQATNGDFAMLPDGGVNTTLWTDFAQRGIHEMAVETKALTAAYYGTPATHAYWDGFSTGGRQGTEEAETNPTDFDGILAGAPVVNWSRFITVELYPQIVQQRDLGGTYLTQAQLDLASNDAIAACDLVNGQHLGYVLDPSTCKYDPTTDATLLCVGVIGSGGTIGTSINASCFSLVQATAMNKIWYGETPDGTVPSPATDNGFATTPATNQLWFGLTRGAELGALAGATEFTIASDQVALELQSSLIADPAFVNATGNGTSAWKNLTYAQLATAYADGITLQPQFANINTDNPDLSAFNNAGRKMIAYHGLADVLVPPEGTLNFYNRVITQMGGLSTVQSFYRLYLVPGMTHGFGNGTSNPTADPPLPTIGQLYSTLTAWVENGTVPDTLTATSVTNTAHTHPLCVYPLKATYGSGDINTAASYTCQ